MEIEQEVRTRRKKDSIRNVTAGRLDGAERKKATEKSVDDVSVQDVVVGKLEKKAERKTLSKKSAKKGAVRNAAAEKLGKIIFSIRDEHDYKQKEFAEKIGLSQSQLSAIESGRQMPTFETMFNISQALNQDPVSFALRLVAQGMILKGVVPGVFEDKDFDDLGKKMIGQVRALWVSKLNDEFGGGDDVASLLDRSNSSSNDSQPTSNLSFSVAKTGAKALISFNPGKKELLKK